jgi:hypothetical protein
MTRPFNVSTPRKRKDGKTFWLKVGAAWSRDDGGFKVDLDALPLPDAEGKVTLLISPPREDDGQRRESAPSRDMPDDSVIPF